MFGSQLALTAGRLSLSSLTKLAREERSLVATARDLAGDRRITNRDQLVAVHAFVAKGVTEDPAFRLLPRPLLRDTAIESLQARRGFCGESARVAVLLLRALGLRANRVYLVGERWNHVVVEHEWLDGHWYLFDAFPDPAMQMSADQLCKYRSDDPTTFPNGYEGNAWVDFYRWRPLIVRGLTKSRPPELYVRMTERPDAIRAGLGIVGAGGGLAIGALAAGGSDG